MGSADWTPDGFPCLGSISVVAWRPSSRGYRNGFPERRHEGAPVSPPQLARGSHRGGLHPPAVLPGMPSPDCRHLLSVHHTSRHSRDPWRAPHRCPRPPPTSPLRNRPSLRATPPHAVLAPPTPGPEPITEDSFQGRAVPVPAEMLLPSRTPCPALAACHAHAPGAQQPGPPWGHRCSVPVSRLCSPCRHQTALC